MRLRLSAIAGATLTGAVLATAAVAPAAPGGSTHVAARASAVSIETPVWARRKPSKSAPRVARIDTYTPLTISQLVLPVVRDQVTAAGSRWVRVRLPGRPNGRSAWIPARGTKPRTLDWRVKVDLSRRLARIYRDGRIVRRFRIVVGARRTPTPRGRFFVVERVKLHTSWARGLWALALSAHSNVLQEFDGGDGQVAMHARGSLPARLGSAASHGCLRFGNRSIAWLGRRLPNGTPVDIVR